MAKKKKKKASRTFLLEAQMMDRSGDSRLVDFGVFVAEHGKEPAAVNPDDMKLCWEVDESELADMLQWLTYMAGEVRDDLGVINVSAVYANLVIA